VGALAVMLMALLVVRSPVATVDRLLHDTGQAHAANAFVGAVAGLHEHEHDGDHDHLGIATDHAEQEAVPGAATVTDDASPDQATLNLHHHHHHDSPSVYALSESPNLAGAWSSSPLPFRLDDDLRQGIDAYQQDRPPKAFLIHVA
jgi:hypothetical protein